MDGFLNAGGRTGRRAPAAALALAWAWMAAGCGLDDFKCDARCREDWLGGGNVYDTASQDSLVSRLYPAPDAATRSRPVVITAHGFTASTFEWREFQDFARDSPRAADGGPVLVSNVLLGGHGRTFADFRASTWKDWAAPVLAEYDTLVRLGYTDISLAGSSTGGTLLLEYLAQGFFRDSIHTTGPAGGRVYPRRFIFVDAIVVPRAKTLSLIRAAGPILGNSPNPGDSLEDAHWYVSRPYEDLDQLYALCALVRDHLEDGIRLPPGARGLVFKSKGDPVVEPVSAVLMYQGLRDAAGRRVEVHMVDSRFHVFTRLADRHATAADSANQTAAFRTVVDGL